jgi:hypothetical protein
MYARPLTGSRIDLESAPERSQPVAHPDQPRPGGGGSAIESRTVVLDRELEPAVALLDADGHAGVRPGVFCDVLERLDAAEVDGGFDVLGIPSRTLGLDRHVQVCPTRGHPERFVKTALLEQWGVDPVGEAAQLTHRQLDLVAEQAK